jgi:glucose/arabinose dehydrogenase
MVRRAAALAIVLAACGSTAGTTTTAGPPATTTTVALATTTTAPTTTTTVAPTTTTTLPPPPPLAEIELATESVASGFERPIFITARPGDPRLYVADQDGKVYALEGGDRTSVLDIRGLTRFAGEQGLLGLAFHPSAPERMFVHYSDNSGDTVIAEYGFPLAVTAADPEPVQLILEVDQPASNHNGGMIGFGPDGYFYIALGDGGGGGDPYHNGQNPHTLLGAILRIDVDGDPPYAIPPDNPFADGVDGAAEVWVYGLRNPWRFSFDGDDLWIGDVGQGKWEEIDLIGPDDAGANLGWNVYEGTHCYRGPAQCGAEGFTPPVHEYPHSDGHCSVTGGYVYRGSAIPDLVGTYLYSDWCTGDLMALRVDETGTVTESRVLAQTEWRLTSFGVDGDGEIYIAREANVYKVVEAP